MPPISMSLGGSQFVAMSIAVDAAQRREHARVAFLGPGNRSAAVLTRAAAAPIIRSCVGKHEAAAG